MMNTIGVAMSGGVDSSVTASLLRQQNYAVHGFFMKLPLPGVQMHLDRVRAVADKLNIPLSIVNMETLFTDRILSGFIESYQAGRTPNPCIACNRLIKFGALRTHMQQNGMEMMATGHYARIGKTGDGYFAVRRGRDSTKDQSYFLCRLDQEQLVRMVLPLGEKTKKEVYALAAELHLDNVHGPESQDICFLAGRSVAAFFSERGIKENPGEIVSSDGRVLGNHRGLWHYTVGQRRGLGLPDATPWYVKSLDAKHNRVIVGKNEELATSEVLVTEVQWTGNIPSRWQGAVQIRGRHRAAEAQVEPADDKRWRIIFAAAQRAVTPGQFAAFYEEDLVRGSGIIV